MNRRERILAAIVGVLLVGAIGYAGVRKLVFDRDRQYDQTRVKLEKELQGLTLENRKVQGTADSIKGWAALTYDTDELRASAKIGGALVALVERAGLSPQNLSLQPVSGKRVRGAYKEVGRTIRVRGRLQNIVDFMYLLEQEPHLHRLDNISVTPVPKTNEIDLQVRYITLVLDSEGTLATDELPSSTTAPTSLDSENRKLFDSIASRDLFRPYVQKRQPPPPPPPRPTPQPRVASSPPRRTP
ncbi:MAG: hypothetical protein WBF17_14560, partial [Phycisphaerae bacterium]